MTPTFKHPSKPRSEPRRELKSQHAASRVQTDVSTTDSETYGRMYLVLPSTAVSLTAERRLHVDHASHLLTEVFLRVGLFRLGVDSAEQWRQTRVTIR